MNILVISNIKGIKAAGPTYSVPRRVLAQEAYDNVFWYNTIKPISYDWIGKANYHDLNEYPSRKISDLPEPFNTPDCVIVEQFYNHAKDPLVREIIKRKIPYIIVPRSELTKQGQSNKKVKKSLANFFFFYKFAKKATAIQYLTEQELLDSGTRWNSNSIVIPNGISKPCEVKTDFSEDGIHMVFIGRIDPYQKGLDLLIEACEEIKDLLNDNNVKIEIYGPDFHNQLPALQRSVKEKTLEHIINFHDGVYGEEKRKLLLQSDLFLLPSRFEGHPMALIEALSYGLPCLVTEGSNMKKEVESYAAGWTCDTSAEGICIQLRKIIGDKDSLARKSDNALALARKYEWDSIAKITHEKISKICNELWNMELTKQEG